MPYVKRLPAPSKTDYGLVKTIQEAVEIINRIASAILDTHSLTRLPLRKIPVKVGSFSSPPLFAASRDTEELSKNNKEISAQPSSYLGTSTLYADR